MLDELFCLGHSTNGLGNPRVRRVQISFRICEVPGHCGSQGTALEFPVTAQPPWEPPHLHPSLH